MAELENPLLNEFCAADTGVATFQSRQGPAPNADQCLKQSLNGCKRFNRNRIADNGIQKSSDPKQVARSAKISELTTNTLMSSKGSMKLPSGFVEQKQFKANTSHCRFMRCDTATKARKRTQLSLGLPTSSKLKRSKRSSSTERRTSIDDLSDVILAEILCRLPCNKFVFQCKSVSKHWCTLIADPYFIVVPNILAQGWRPPMSNYVKINFDGAWKKDSHLAGLGVVARDAIGSFYGGLATPFHCNLALVAEAAACLCALKFALNHNFTDIIFKTDSKILVEGVRGGGKNGVWAIQRLLDEFKICLF
ncbi:PREDICTED: uncharacterized protein LOC103333092 [Prunus mume]|uniref:Uncharacterized protein LOC103333092 n=1 Tax=Prunus mume TaxID=102107 RepID=A0ABM1LQW8_PRUMU|nr:PREDICTED: uncharacterized protein LOC103333092 [Prunus mume]